MAYKKILIAITGEGDDQVIHEAVRLASSLNAEIRVVRVNDPAAGDLTMMMDRLPAVEESDIRDEFSRLGYGDIAGKLSIEIREASSVTRGITEAIRDADLLILGHHRKNPIIPINSTDEKLLDRVSCSVLIVSIQ